MLRTTSTVAGTLLLLGGLLCGWAGFGVGDVRVRRELGEDKSHCRGKAYPKWQSWGRDKSCPTSFHPQATQVHTLAPHHQSVPSGKTRNLVQLGFSQEHVTP